MSTASYASAVRGLYAAALEPRLWPEVLDEAAKAAGAEGANVFYFRADGSPGIIVSERLQAANAAYFAEGWFAQDVFAQRAAEAFLGPGAAYLRDSDLVTPEERRDLPIYSQFYTRFGLGRLTSISVMLSGGLQAALGFHRGTEQGDYSDGQVGIMIRLAHHLERALPIGLALVDGKVVADGLDALVESLDLGVITIGRDLRILGANRSATIALRNRMLTPGARFETGSPKVDAELTRRLSESRDDEPPLLLTQSGQQEAVLLQVLPVNPSSVNVIPTAAHHALVVVTPLRSQRGIDPASLRSLFGLTNAEARLASLAGRGDELSDIATTLGITAGTARGVLQRVFTKTGVNRQADLIALLSRIGREQGDL